MRLQETGVCEGFQRSVVCLDILQVTLTRRPAGKLELLRGHPLILVLDALAADPVGEPGQVKLCVLLVAFDFQHLLPVDGGRGVFAGRPLLGVGAIAAVSSGLSPSLTGSCRLIGTLIWVDGIARSTAINTAPVIFTVQAC